jgi:hypothetical protein
MSPGIQTITRLNLPLEIRDRDIRCPECGRGIVIWDVVVVNEASTKAGRLSLRCESEPTAETVKWRLWYERHGAGGDGWPAVEARAAAWFNQFYRFRVLAPEVVEERKRKRNRLKFRRG